MNDFNIQSITVNPLNIALTDNFTISKGSVTKVNNLLVTVTLTDGSTGYGEIAPFEELSGEDKKTCITRYKSLDNYLIGKSVKTLRKLSGFLLEALPDSPAVRCGLEMGMADALTRKLKIPLWNFWGGLSGGPLKTDITIPILSYKRSIELADLWYKKGFRTLKIKVGTDYDSEIRLVSTLAKNYPNIRFILDANQGFEENEALEFIRELLRKDCTVILYEQPVNRHNLEAMARLTNLLSIPVAADESVFTINDMQKVIKLNAANVINLKIMKSGIYETLQIAATALSFGLDLMIGGMVESRLAMGYSASLALGYCPVKYIDLDTPLLMESDPFLGGYSYCGPEIRSWDNPGLGMVPIF